MNPGEVKKLLTVVNGGGRFKDDDVLTAWLLLRELHDVAWRTMPTLWDRVMRFIHQPGKFDPAAPSPRVAGLLHRVPPPSHAAPPRRTDTPPPEAAMELDVQGGYLLFNNRPGSANPLTGVDFDYAYRVGRRSVFGYALGRILAPIDRDASTAFRRHYALLVVLPGRYREAVVEHDRAHPQRPFTPQIGPVYTIHRPRRDPSQVANMSRDDVIQTLLDNRIPPEWVDHAYGYGITFLNGHYGDGWIDSDLLQAVDNEHVARLRRYGEPQAIAAWDGWRSPTPEEVRSLHATMAEEELRSAERGNTQPRMGLNAPGWLLAGQTGRVEYLTRRPQRAAEEYLLSHSVDIPSYLELGGGQPATQASDGNPPAVPATSDDTPDANAAGDESMDAIVDVADSQPEPTPDVNMAAAELTREGENAADATPPRHSGAT